MMQELLIVIDHIMSNKFAVSGVLFTLALVSFALNRGFSLDSVSAFGFSLKIPKFAFHYSSPVLSATSATLMLASIVIFVVAIYQQALHKEPIRMEAVAPTLHFKVVEDGTILCEKANVNNPSADSDLWASVIIFQPKGGYSEGVIRIPVAVNFRNGWMIGDEKDGYYTCGRLASYKISLPIMLALSEFGEVDESSCFLTVEISEEWNFLYKNFYSNDADHFIFASHSVSSGSHGVSVSTNTKGPKPTTDEIDEQHFIETRDTAGNSPARFSSELLSEIKNGLKECAGH